MRKFYIIITFIIYFLCSTSLLFADVSVSIPDTSAFTGDTLYIPPTVMAKAMRVIKPVADPIGTASGLGRTVVSPF
ncbi:MAG: hypothetical protein GY861_16835 [bacterium]|nr:hypothetical protein [bacterium]